MTSLLSINLRVMGKSNITLLGQDTIFSVFSKLGLPKYFDIIIMGLVVIGILIFLMYCFFKTEFGQALIATGDNEKMARALGINTRKMTVFGLMLSNALIALAGAILAQNNGYADVNSGLGTIVIALAAIIIGEVIFADESFVGRLVCILYGSIIYRLLLMLVLLLNVFQANDFKLISAALIAFCLTVPQIKSWIQQKSTRHRKGGKLNEY